MADLLDWLDRPYICYFQEVRLIFPNSQRLNRGNYVMSQLVNACRANEVTDLVIVHEHRGEPGEFPGKFPSSRLDCLKKRKTS